MSVSKVIIHEIIKEQKSKDASLFLSNETLPKETKTERLSPLLNNAFAKDDVIYGIFKEDKNEFYYKFNEYLKLLTDDAFTSFTQELTEELQGIIKDEFLAKGGFLVFSEYEINRVRFFGIYLIRDVEGMLFQKHAEGHTFEVNLTKYMDTNKLAMGCRINIDKLQNQDTNHLSLIKGGQADISTYFSNWIGVDKPESNKDFTDRLFNIVSDIPTPLNPKTNSPYDINETRELAFNSIKASAGKVVNLKALSLQLYGDENIIIQFVSDNGLEIDSEFKYDSRSLSKFKRIEANRDGIRLAFSRGDFNSRVQFPADDSELITIRSQKLADALRIQIGGK